MEELKYIREPTDLQCGQAALAMALDVPVVEITKYLGHERETTLDEMKRTLRHFGKELSAVRVPVETKEELPEFCLLSLETPRCWHWSLYYHGKFYDPEHGVMDDFPESKRRYYWEIY